MSKVNEGIVVVFPKDNKGGLAITGAGTKFYTQDGHEIKGVVAFGIPKTGRDDILGVQITVALSEIKYAE